MGVLAWNLFPCAIALLLATAGLQAQTSQPPPLPGEILPESLGRETPKADFFVIGLRLTNDFDDNVLNSGTDKQYALTGVVEPHLGWALLGSRYSWLLDYRFGLSSSYPVSVYDSRSHLLDSALQIDLTRRLKLRLRNRFDASKDRLSRFLEPDSAAGFGFLDRPNDYILTSAVNRSSEQAGVDVSYALGPHSLAAVSGSFFQVNYGTPQALQPGQISGTQTFENSSSLSGHAVYLHHLRPAYWAGLEYSVRKLTAQSFQSPVLVNSVLLTQTISFTPNMTLALFAGPEYSTTQNGVNIQPGLTTAPSSAWQWAGGATYTWTHPHADFTALGYHQISDGGGLLGIVRVSGGTTQFRYKLSPIWTANVMGAYERNQPILAAVSPISYGSALAGLGCRLTLNLSVDFFYGRTYLPLSSTLSKFADHNRASVSLVYEFKKSR
jgi:hypothetical protein